MSPFSASGCGAFIRDYEGAYGSPPNDAFAALGYDAARLLGSALNEVKGDVSDLDILRKAIRKADFDTVRGKFAFSANQHPIQDIYIREVVKAADGSYTNRTIKTVFKDHSNVYVEQCKMK
mgnify:CR=1 FL=1